MLKDMNSFKNIMGHLSKGILLMFVAGMTAVSCQYDDSELREQIDILVDKVYELETRLNSEIDALKAMLEGKVMITEVSTDAATGITTVKLSDESQTCLYLYPKADMTAFITYMEASIDGRNVNCWAYIDEDGKKRYLRDSKDQPIPIETSTPEIVERDGDTYLVIDGVEYPISGNSVFSDYELQTDPLTGDVYAVTFTFGEDMTFTVSVDGASGFWFVSSAGGFWGTEIINDYFVAKGLTERVQVDARGVVDYVLQIPDGWRVKEYEDIYMGARYFDITAPAAELIESGVAAAEGELKVVAVLEGGKATVAKLYLSSEPFSRFSVSLGNVSVDMYNGLQKYVYGICPASEYDEDAIFAVAEGLLTAYEYPEGYGVADCNLADEPAENIAGKELVPGETYVFWAIPALYYYSTVEESGYYLERGTFVKQEFTYSSVKFEVGNESFRDATLTMELQGISSYYAGVLPAADYLLEDIVYNLNNPGYYTALTTPMTYEGSVFSFADVTAEQATSYVAWFAVAEDGRTYTSEDVIICEFSTLNLTAGGSVKVVAGEVSATAIDVVIPVEAEGAETIYYSYLKSSAASKYTTDEERAAYLFENGKSVKASSADTKLSDCISKVQPETSYVFMAVASDSEGKYGAVFTMDCTTTEIKYNNLEVKLSLVKNDPNDVAVSIAADGAESFIYWVGKVSDNTWKSSNYMGGSAESAQVYMYLNPTQYRIVSVMESYPVKDGVVTMTDLSLKEEYVFIAMAKDKDGLYSKAAVTFFTTRSIALGEVVKSDDARWASMKPTLTWVQEGFSPATGMMYAKYTFTYDCPDDMTAYVMCGTESYITDGGTITGMTVEDRIIKIVEMTDKACDKELLVDEELWDSTGSQDAWQYFRFQHGCALFGNAVVFQPSHHEECSSCASYSGKHEIVTYSSTQGPIEFRMPYAVGSNDTDKVYIVLKDAQNNYYEEYMIDVPDEYFETATED